MKRYHSGLSRVRTFGLLLAVIVLCVRGASGQATHDAFDKPLGYDTGREEQAAHDSLNRTGSEDSNADSQSATNGAGRTGADRNQNRQQQAQDRNRRSDDDDDAQHHAALGISIRETDGHVSVLAVMPGSPAAKAGLRVGDQIRYVGDQKIATAEGLAEEIGEYRPGSKVDLSIRRKGEKQTLTATLGSRQYASNYQRVSRNDDQNRQYYGPDNRYAQANRSRAIYSYEPDKQQNDRPQQSTNQRLRELQQQLSQIQQQLSELQTTLDSERR